MTERYEYLSHPLLRRRVRDVASGVEGELMAVVNENVSNSVRQHWMELAYIRGPSGREFATAVANVESAVCPGAPPDGGQPPTSRST
ncbi:hypothetical protein [Streptomyces sp. NPDC091371]|uniref:hypothetical protein n=1 Tax=Streptomyces sp. NPDC091371 TaxID=3155303 RepID=UPI00343B99D8